MGRKLSGEVNIMAKYKVYMDAMLVLEVESPTDDAVTIKQLAKDQAEATPADWWIKDYFEVK
jgi:hypothetical protein